MASQDRTLDHYQELMTINATAHILRSARELGVFRELAAGQKTLAQLSGATSVSESRLNPLLQTLRVIGIIELYVEDYALSSTARLLCQYDEDLGDAVWNQLTATLQSPEQTADASTPLPLDRLNAIAATQWVHTPTAMQAAEMLDVGAEGADASADSADSPVQLLDFGCGAAVWSCAIAHRSPRVHVTAVDSDAALQAAAATAASIDLTERFTFLPADLLNATLPANHFDIAIIAQHLHSLSSPQIDQVLSNIRQSIKPLGRVVVIDQFVGPARAGLAESLECLRMIVQTVAAQPAPLKLAQDRMERAGLTDIQFTYIAASRVGLGMMVGTKP